MKENESFNFNFDDYEDIISSSKKEEDSFEDIISDSRMSKNFTFEDIMSSSTPHSHSKESKFVAWWRALSKGKRAALISVTSLFLVVAIVLGVFFSVFNYNYNDITEDPLDLGFQEIINDEVINIALFGLDTRNEKSFKGNSDSIMLLSLNTNTKKVKIVSVMRDTFVPMENNGKTTHGKINSAYAKGPEHAIKTLNNIFRLDISEYATVNFYGMTDIIDAVGGITATITQDELTWKGNDRPNLNNCMDEICAAMKLDPKKYYIKKAGEQQLNGVQAVAYSRIRYCRTVWDTNNDYGRTDRQRHVMEQLFNKALTLPKSQYAKLAKALIPCTETSLSYSEILGLAYNILLGSPTFEQYRLPPAEHQSEFLMASPSGFGSVIYYDLDYAADLIHGMLYDDLTMEEYIEQNGIKTNSWYKGGPGSYKPSTTPSNNESAESTPSDDNGSSETPSDNSSTISDASSNPSSSSDEEEDEDGGDGASSGPDKNSGNTDKENGDTDDTDDGSDDTDKSPDKDDDDTDGANEPTQGGADDDTQE